MAINWNSPRVWFEHVAENTIRSAAAAALGALPPAASGQIPWYGLGVAAGIGALASILTALAGLKLQPDNGTDSVIRRVVADDSRPA